MSRMLIGAAMPEHVKIDGRQLKRGNHNDKIVRDPAVDHHVFHQGRNKAFAIRDQVRCGVNMRKRNPQPTLHAAFGERDIDHAMFFAFWRDENVSRRRESFDASQRGCGRRSLSCNAIEPFREKMARKNASLGSGRNADCYIRDPFVQQVDCVLPVTEASNP
jgi:hypothetical protein